jgi:hypothetical protein
VKKNLSKVQKDKKQRVNSGYKAMKRQNRLKNIEQEKEINKLKRKEAMEKKMGMTRQNKDKKPEDGDWEDIDEHERDVFDKDGYYDVMNEQDDIGESDLQLLEKFQAQK